MFSLIQRKSFKLSDDKKHFGALSWELKLVKGFSQIIKKFKKNAFF